MNKKYVILLLCLSSLFCLTACNSWIEEDPESEITDERVGDSNEAAAEWLTGTYSKWIDDMFRWGYFPRVLEFDADLIGSSALSEQVTSRVRVMSLMPFGKAATA